MDDGLCGRTFRVLVVKQRQRVIVVRTSPSLHLTVPNGSKTSTDYFHKGLTRRFGCLGSNFLDSLVVPTGETGGSMKFGFCVRNEGSPAKRLGALNNRLRRHRDSDPDENHE